MEEIGCTWLLCLLCTCALFKDPDWESRYCRSFEKHSQKTTTINILSQVDYSSLLDCGKKAWKPPVFERLRWSLATYRFQASLLGHTNWVPQRQCAVHLANRWSVAAKHLVPQL